MNVFFEHINTFLVFALLFQALIFSIIFLRRRNGHPEKILGIYEFVYFITYLIVFTYYLKEYQIYIIAYAVLLPLYATLTVLFYLFIKTLTTGKFLKKDRYHFILPVLIFLINIVILSLQDYQGKYAVIVENRLVNDNSLQKFFFAAHNRIFPLILISQSFLYVYFCVREVLKFRRKIQNEYSYSRGINLKWAIELLVLYMVLFIIAFIITAEVYRFSALLLIALLIGINGIHYIHKTFCATLVMQESDITAHETTDKYNYSALTRDEKHKLMEQINQFMTSGKQYLNPDLRITDISHALNSNRSYISQVINENTGVSFYHFVNSYRITEFIEQYKSDEFRNMSLEGISSMVGFKCKSSFYNAFKKSKGCTPSEYIQKIS